MAVQVFGIRHHGPGCARSLRGALEALQPDVVLVEGPPDAGDVLSLLARPEFEPPVALLIYPAEAPERAVFYPFAVFSPEWQALQYAAQHQVPARFMDLPQWHQLAMERLRAEAVAGKEPEAEQNGQSDAGPAGAPSTARPPEGSEAALEDDPIGMLALAAGYKDRELWWEHQIEQRQDATGLFDGILAAMAALRSQQTRRLPFEAEREAHMRQAIRAAEKEGAERIAVVCGAWHAPALANRGPAREDQALLQGLPKMKTAATWVPWTYSRLSYRSGYGAGIASPGWYDHLWRSRDRAAVRWSTHVARLLREEDLDASSASVIETVRLAEALAALRDLPLPGLLELNEAALTVFCHGDPMPMRLIRDKLEISDRLGKVPADTPTVPLQRDLEAQQKELRLKATPEIKQLDLDLRNDTDRRRSHLLHRLALLQIPWGQFLQAGGKVSTFHELWKLQWQPEFVVALIEASVWGHTVAQASAAFVASKADEANELPALTALLDGTTLADLPDASNHILGRLQALAAVSADVRHLMDALPPLAQVARYGDVRGTRTEQVLPILAGLFERILVGLAGACASLDDEAAARMVESIANVQRSLDLLDNAEQRPAWQQVLRDLADRDTIHGLVRGWCCRLLLEQRALAEAELERRARLALSPAVPLLQAATWIEGLLRGSGLVLLHEDALWLALDQWLRELGPEPFIELLPVLRRAFAGFQAPERRAMGDKVKSLGKGAKAARDPVNAPGVHAERAARVLPVLAQVLGVKT
jgi:Family of unknown function (DUF5682)